MSAIEFFEDQYGTVCLRRSLAVPQVPQIQPDGPWWVEKPLPQSSFALVRPPSEHHLFAVQHAPFHAFADAYGLSNVRRALLGIRLDRCHREHLRALASYKSPSDPAALKQLVELRITVERLVKLDRSSHRYQGAMSAAIEVTGGWSQFVGRGAKLPNSSLSISAGFHMVQWLTDASRALEVIRSAEKMLATSVSDAATPSIGAETALYGFYLPRLYELVTGKTFGISRSNNRVNVSGGVAFVIGAAEAIGLHASGSNVESHFGKAKRAGLWKHASQSGKKRS